MTYWLALALAALCWRAADACSCSPHTMHPQTQYCKSDFVIVGRVQRIFKENATEFSTETAIYKVKIRNILKVTPKALVALKSGRILTPAMPSMCGVTLQPRETYVITGFVEHLRAHVHLCNYVSKWRDVTPRQRKGFRLLYKQGCTCKVHLTFSPNAIHRPVSRNTCVAPYDDCYERHGICLRNRSGRCVWTRAPRFTRCLQAQTYNGTKT